jgi:dihydrofolate reductase
MSNNKLKIAAFEKDFQDACLKHGISAAFVLVKSSGEKGSMLMIGGSKTVSDFIERSLVPQTVEHKERRHN